MNEQRFYGILINRTTGKITPQVESKNLGYVEENVNHWNSLRGAEADYEYRVSARPDAIVEVR